MKRYILLLTAMLCTACSTPATFSRPIFARATEQPAIICTESKSGKKYDDIKVPIYKVGNKYYVQACPVLVRDDENFFTFIDYSSDKWYEYIESTGPSAYYEVEQSFPGCFHFPEQVEQALTTLPQNSRSPIGNFEIAYSRFCTAGDHQYFMRVTDKAHHTWQALYAYPLGTALFICSDLPCILLNSAGILILALFY
ncbi:MAG: hypothetical protein IKZ13_05520 [Akkermansia sp.]|nr:hypothetical protein [Akkermansia sp.]